MAATLRTLDTEHDWPLSRQTLFDWRDQEGWDARRAAEEADAKRRERAQKLDRSAMLAGIDLQLERYERAFREADAANCAPNPKLTSAYANLARLRLDTLRDIEGGAGVDRGDLVAEAVEWLSTWTAEHVPEHAQALHVILSAAAGPLAEHVAGQR